MREGAWGIHINQAEYLVYVVWAGSKEITEYTSDAQELRYWSSGAQKMWWTTDPDTSRSAGAGGGSGSTSSSSGWASVDGNSTDFTPWFVTTDSAGNIYVTASDETEDGVDRDVFKYDGESGSVIGRLSNCLGGVCHRNTCSWVKERFFREGHGRGEGRMPLLYYIYYSFMDV